MGCWQNLDLLLWMVEAEEVIYKVEEMMRPMCKNRLNWPDFTSVNKLINCSRIEDDSNFSWLCTARLNQFIAFMACNAFFSFFSMLKIAKRRIFLNLANPAQNMHSVARKTYGILVYRMIFSQQVIKQCHKCLFSSKAFMTLFDRLIVRTSHIPNGFSVH